MRPTGDNRQHLLRTAQQAGPLPARELLARAGLTQGSGPHTFWNAVRARELVPVGRERLPHARRWVKVYEAVPRMAGGAAVGMPAARQLQQVLCGWCRQEAGG